MAKLKHLCAAILFLTSVFSGYAQTYVIHYRTPEADTLEVPRGLDLQRQFKTKTDAIVYVGALPAFLRSKGYLSASIDDVQYDSLSASATIFLGEKYQWTKIITRATDEDLLQAIRWPAEGLTGNVEPSLLTAWQKKILDYLEDNGHPFGKVYLDSVAMEGGAVNAQLRIDRGPLYHIDSIRIFGDARVKNELIQHYIDIYNGSIYSKKKLKNISARLAEVTYLEEEKPADVTLLSSGSVLNLYLKNRKTNQVNALIGLQPNSDQLSGNKKLLITVDANILLRNALGSGETIGLIWQQLQQQSPRLNLLYDQPYMFHSPFGVNFSFDMYKRDSSFLNLNMNLGATYRLEQRQSTTVFLQRRQTIVTSINEDRVKATRQLPDEGDVKSINLGIGYTFNNTDFRFNPRKGNEFTVTSTAGTKKIKKNNQVLELSDPSDPAFDYDHLYDTVKLKAYQFRVVASGAHYIPVGTQSTIRVGFYAGTYQTPRYFRNELFQIGGFKLLRGFDEESQFVSSYGIGSLEYRYRLGLNSFFFVFGDGGWGKHLLETKKDHAYIGTGVGLSLETKAGIINMAWAVGKRDDTQLNLRQSKVHIGFASYF